MKKTETTTLRRFQSQDEADAYMRRKNRTHRDGDGQVFCLLEGPDAGEWTVMDLRSAIETELPYRWGF